MNDLWITSIAILAIVHFAELKELGRLNGVMIFFLSPSSFRWCRRAEHLSVFLKELLCEYQEERLSYLSYFNRQLIF